MRTFNMRAFNMYMRAVPPSAAVLRTLRLEVSACQGQSSGVFLGHAVHLRSWLCGRRAPRMLSCSCDLKRMLGCSCTSLCTVHKL
jgi:hypothetical protein